MKVAFVIGWASKYFYEDQELKNKVDTTNRCEALKEVMSLNYV